MPPFVTRKRARSPSPPLTTARKSGSAAKPTAKRPKPSLFDAVDAPSKSLKTAEENRKLLESLNADSEDDSSLSEAASDDFEDVPAPTGAKRVAAQDAGGEESDDGMEWEDAVQQESSTVATPGVASTSREHDIGDIEVSINDDGSYIEPTVHGAVNKKGPSKRERQVRIQSHCLHVQALLWHNTVRNSWVNDKEVQKTLIDGMSDGVKREVTRWKEAMPTQSKDELEARKKVVAEKSKGKGKKSRKAKHSGRDWNYEAEHLEQGVPNLSGGDPLLRLLKVLTAYWRKRFTITAPGLRKQGYKPLRRLREELKDWQTNHNQQEHGERIENRQQFRALAKKCEGSRDVGAQLFAALLRGMDLETRMVANLQPVGFGWSKAEDADAKRPRKAAAGPATLDLESEQEVKPAQNAVSKKAKVSIKTEKPARRSGRGVKAEPIELDDSDSSLSSPLSESAEGDDDISVIDITPDTPRKRPTQKYDRDLAFPNYWVEVRSPVSNKYIPVDPIVLTTIGSNDELVQSFEPRGKKAEKAKQVICYTIAFAKDGTAKDVTIRYLKRHQLPGKTKGMRMPAEKVPVYNRKGKVKRYELYDWFRTVMSGYDRPSKKRTAADDLEEQTDLKPFKPAKEQKEVEKESLQWYKQSADYVLEQHLRREEAILPDAMPVKMFTAGKGDKAEEHPVFRRSDVVACKTVESWHKEGRALREGQHPMKLVAMRAVTLIRKREMEDALRETGEKLKQGLYSRDQTDWIIPPPIQHGVIPKNAFGNMDVYVPTMVPKGAVHLPLKGSAKLCRKLDIDYAEACTGFEFGKQRAVPVITGVVVAEEHEILVRDAWRADQAELKRKEDTKRTELSLKWWRKMLMGLRVLHRLRTEYQDVGAREDEVNPFVARAQRAGKGPSTQHQEKIVIDVDGDGDVEMGGGGFFPPGHDEEEVPQRTRKSMHNFDAGDDDESGGGFMVDDEAPESVDMDAEAGAGGFLVEEDADNPAQANSLKNHAPITPVSLQSMHKGVESDGGSEDEHSEEDAIAPRESSASRRRSRPAKAPGPGGKANIATKSKATVPFDDHADADSSISSLSSTSYETDADNALTTERKSKVGARKKPSPTVVVTPQQKRTLAIAGQRGVQKVTPKRSQYFAEAEDESERDHHGDDDDDNGAESEAESGSELEEVVLSRRTTARTRGKV